MSLMCKEGSIEKMEVVSSKGFLVAGQEAWALVASVEIPSG